MNRISIFHYHLHPGGVTNVIELGALALIKYFPGLELLRLVCGSDDDTDRVRSRINSAITKEGADKTPNFRFEISIMPDIGYSDDNGLLQPEKIIELSQKIEKKFGDSIWWIHNYQIGKNPLFTAAVLHSAKVNPERKILFHIHDFPECARFDNLNRLLSAGIKNPYPIAGNVLYSLINSRDLKLLMQAGIPRERLFLLNNPVEAPSSENIPKAGSAGRGERPLRNFYRYFADRFPSARPEGKTIFYPVRSIRRKNILEAGLICAASEEPVNLIVGLPGVSAQERAYSEACSRCFEDGLIPGVWGSGLTDSPSVPAYEDMLGLCDLIISSSVQEGFGYLFINAVQLGTPLLAHYLNILDGIRAVFPEQSSFFYERIIVPSDESWEEDVKQAYLNKIESLRGRISGEAVDELTAVTESISEGGVIDFSYLPVEHQILVLRRVSESAEYKTSIRNLNKTIFENFSKLLDNGRTGKNKSLEEFSLKSHADTVRRIFSAFPNKNRMPEQQKTDMAGRSVQQNLLDEFAKIEYMRLIYDYKKN
ncbi:MAG: hypothetical protein JEZ04_12120 [Spirochaetales bacterium]|nr:hypothetical protein [Spirochaetales bacterium]